MGIFELVKIGTDSHYEKSIAQAAAKVKHSLLIICRLKLLIPWSVGGWGY